MHSSCVHSCGRLMWIPFIVVGFAWGATAQDDGVVPDEGGNVQPVLLKFTTHERFSLSVPGDAGSVEVVFKKEPTYSGGDVVRGFLPVGTEKKDHVAFAFDVDDEKLYVDLNRNFDLTDDPGGTYSSSEKYWTEFKNVRVTLDTEAGSVPYVLSVRSFMDDVNVSVRSGWQGECQLGGRPWTFAVVDNLDGVIDGEDEFVMWSKDEAVFGDWPEHVRAASRLAVNGTAYDVSFVQEGENWKATFTNVTVPTGGLELSGERIGRLILAGADAPTVLVDFPGSQIPVPVAIYNHEELYVNGGEKGPFYFASAKRAVEILENQTATFEAGGPLNNTLDVARTGGLLTFEYQVVGAGGLEYEPADRNGEGGLSLPKVLISKDGKQISSGAFEYG